MSVVLLAILSNQAKIARESDVTTTAVNVLTQLTVVRLTGEKTQSFLQGQLTCDMQLLSQHGQAAFAACCDHRGRMMANFWVVKWFDDFLLIVPESITDFFKKHLQKYAVFSKVALTIENHFFIAEGRDADKENHSVVCISLSNDRTLILAEKNPFPDVNLSQDEIIWRKNNIADELAILCDKTSLLFTPQMIGLEKRGGVSFTKGCYVGQEIIARTQHLGTLKRHLHRFTVTHHDNLSPGDALKNKNNETMGVVIDALSLNDHVFDVLAVIEDRYWQSLTTA